MYDQDIQIPMPSGSHVVSVGAYKPLYSYIDLGLGVSNPLLCLLPLVKTASILFRNE